MSKRDELAAEAELEPFRQLRYRCPHCRKSFAHKSYAFQHISTMCQKREANRACGTCALFQEGEPESHDGVYPGSPRSCGAGVDLSDGLLSTHCPEWMQSAAKATA